MTEAAIDPPCEGYHVSLGEPLAQGAWAVSSGQALCALYLAGWAYGCAGGFLAATDRRYRKQRRLKSSNLSTEGAISGIELRFMPLILFGVPAFSI